MTPLRRTPQARVQEPGLSPRVSCSRCGADWQRHNYLCAERGERSYTGRTVRHGKPEGASAPQRTGMLDGPWTTDRMREIVRGMAA